MLLLDILKECIVMLSTQKFSLLPVIQFCSFRRNYFSVKMFCCFLLKRLLLKEVSFRFVKLVLSTFLYVVTVFSCDR